MTDTIGWISSFVLILTLVQQLYTQWRSGKSEGVSRWLFVGQIAASAGFTLYSVLLENWVFVVTNATLLVAAVLGLALVLVQRRPQRTGRRQGSCPRRELGVVHPRDGAAGSRLGRWHALGR